MYSWLQGALVMPAHHTHPVYAM